MNYGKMKVMLNNRRFRQKWAVFDIFNKNKNIFEWHTF